MVRWNVQVGPPWALRVCRLRHGPAGCLAGLLTALQGFGLHLCFARPVDPVHVCAGKGDCPPACHCLLKWMSYLRLQPKIPACCLPDEHLLSTDQKSPTCSADVMPGTHLCAGQRPVRWQDQPAAADWRHEQGPKLWHCGARTAGQQPQQPAYLVLVSCSPTFRTAA